MKSSSYFWGVLLIFCGLFLFAMQFEWIVLELSFAKYLWPLVIVFIGISLFNIPQYAKNTLAGLSGAILAFFLIGLFTGSFCSNCDGDWSLSKLRLGGKGIYSSHSVIYLDEGTQTALLQFKGALGDVKIDKTTNNLIEMENDHEILDMDVSDTDSVNKLVIVNSLAGSSTENEPNTKLTLNPKIIWDMEFSSSAANVEADLRDYRVRKIDVSSAISNLDMKIGRKRDTVNIDIESSISDISIEVPKDFACRINSKTALSDADFKGFTRSGDTYETENFNKTNRVIFINIESGLSSIKVRRR